MYLETKLTYLEPVVDFLFYFFLICFGNLLEDLDALVCLTPLSQPANRFLNKAGNSWIQFSTLDQWDFVLYQSYNGVMKIIAAWAKITTWNIFQSCSALWIVNKLDIICVINCLNGNYIPKYPRLNQAGNCRSKGKSYINHQAPPSHAHTLHN